MNSLSFLCLPLNRTDSLPAFHGNFAILAPFDLLPWDVYTCQGRNHMVNKLIWMRLLLTQYRKVFNKAPLCFLSSSLLFFSLYTESRNLIWFLSMYVTGIYKLLVWIKKKKHLNINMVQINIEAYSPGLWLVGWLVGHFPPRSGLGCYQHPMSLSQ